MWGVLHRYFELQRNRNGNVRRLPGAPMSGYVAALFMMHLCDSVTLYGFSDYKPKVQ